jgi:Lon protease-like protein
VLLPSMPLPLHIFEPRYQQMIAHCMGRKLEFGLVLAANNSVASVGCTAEILHKIREYPDGQLDILTEGRSRFRLNEMLSEKAYYQGMVEYLTDAPFTPEAPNQSALIERFQQCHLLLFDQPWARSSVQENVAISYGMAGHLPMELAHKQTLLEMRSEAERQAFLLHWLDEFLPKLAQRHHGRKLAGGNGHALN